MLISLKKTLINMLISPQRESSEMLIWLKKIHIHCDMLISRQKATSKTLFFHLRNSYMLISWECVTTEMLISLKEDS